VRASRGSTPAAGSRNVQLRDVLRVLVRGLPFAAVVTAVAVTTAITVTRASDPVYRASVTLVATQSPPRFADMDVVVPPVVDPTVYRTALFEGDVLRDALVRVEGRPLRETEVTRFAEAIRVTLESQQLSSIIRIEVRDPSPERATQLANTIAEELVAWDRGRARQALAQGIAALERSIAILDDELAGNGAPLTDARRATLTDLRAQRAGELQAAQDASAAAVAIGLIEPLRVATPPEVPVGPRLVLNTAVALILGLVAGYGILLIGWTINPRIASREDLARFTQLPVLAEFPRRRRASRRLSAESTSLLRTRLARVRSEQSCLVVVVTSIAASSDNEGVAVSLAESFARSGEATLLVDADLRRARASAWLDASGTRVTPYDDPPSAGGGPSVQPVTVIVDGERTFDFLPARAGTQQPVDRLVRVFRDGMAAWRQEYGVIVVDAAPLLPHADALAVSSSATGVVVCAAIGRANKRDLDAALESLADEGTQVLGIVLTNGARHASPVTSGGVGTDVPAKGARGQRT
jgi:Mrp family chromosome partitioning ATPase